MYQGIVGGLFGIGTTYLNNYLAGQRAQQDRRENYLLGEKAAENADRRTRALYNDLYSPSALMRQYKESGMSPGLLMGGTPGQGGMSGSINPGAGGIQTPYIPINAMEAAQLGMIKAQKENIEADTANKSADTAKKQKEAAYTAAQTTWQNLCNYVKDETKDWDIAIVKESLAKLGNESTLAFWEGLRSKQNLDFENETFKDRAKILEEQWKNFAADTLLKDSEKRLSDEQKQAIREQLNIEWNKVYSMYLHNVQEYINGQLNREQFEFEVEKTKKEFNRQGALLEYNMKKEILEIIHDDVFNVMNMVFTQGGQAAKTAGQAAAVMAL